MNKIVRSTNTRKMIKFIEENLKKRGFYKFTHKDIMGITYTNCPYSILRNLKKYYEIEFTDKEQLEYRLDIFGIKRPVTKKYREYTIRKRINEWEETESLEN